MINAGSVQRGNFNSICGVKAGPSSRPLRFFKISLLFNKSYFTYYRIQNFFVSKFIFSLSVRPCNMVFVERINLSNTRVMCLARGGKKCHSFYLLQIFRLFLKPFSAYVRLVLICRFTMRDVFWRMINLEIADKNFQW